MYKSWLALAMLSLVVACAPAPDGDSGGRAARSPGESRLPDGLARAGGRLDGGVLLP